MFNPFRKSTTQNVSIDEAQELIKKDSDVLILDVRTPAEYKSGHIPNAINIPHNTLIIRLNEIEKYKDKNILVHCQSGGRSSIAVQILEQQGFNKIYHMKNGFGAWKYEVEK